MKPPSQTAATLTTTVIIRQSSIMSPISPGTRELKNNANTPIGESGWLGNPFPVAVFGREESIARYCEALIKRVERDSEFGRALVEEVHGRTLGCWCRPLNEDEPRCHGSVLVKISQMLASQGGETK